MYTPLHFRIDDTEELAAIIDGRRFASLVVMSENGPEAAHVPMILTRDHSGAPATLEGHLARSNPLAAIAQQAVRGLAIFNGPDAYVTPNLYPSKREHGKVVPTWNYIAVQVYGVVETFNDPAELRQQVSLLTDMMEGGAPAPWKVSDAPEDYIRQMLAAITGVRLRIDRLAGVRKLSQNRFQQDRASVLAGFTGSDEASARQLAVEMSKKA